MPRPIALTLALAVMAAALPGLVTDFADAATHDGRWSVLTITEKGTCDRAYRYELRIANGKVSYAGDDAFDL
jgi:hypothetical protein